MIGAAAAAKEVIIFLIFVSVLNGHLLKPHKKPQPITTAGPFYLTEPSPEDKNNIQSFIMKTNKNLSGEEAGEMAAFIVKYADENKIDAKLVTALIARESRFNANATSSSGAKGLGQFIPSTAKLLGVTDPYDPEQNVRATAAYLKQLVDRWQGKENTVELALASYKVGWGTVTKAGGVPQDASTQEYIESIKKYYQKIGGM